MDSRQETIKKKIVEYQILKRDYYEQNKEKRLEYDREYREYSTGTCVYTG